MGEVSKLAASQGLASHQGSQNCRTRSVTDERRDLDQICGGDHGRLYRWGLTTCKA